MKPGDLRRFRDGLKDPGKTERISGQPFVVINIHPYPHPDAQRGQVDFLVGGRIETGWSLMWVMNNSEVISEAG
jgi:hypothetical protein